MKEKQAFTLAEVLISLTIIGVIAAITVPALIQRTNKQEYVSALQKTYSTLSQAANMIIAEHGSPASSTAGSNDGWAYSVDNIYNLFKSHLINAKECGTETAKCVMTFEKYLNGDTYEQRYSQSNAIRSLILADGTIVHFNKDTSGLSPLCNTWMWSTPSACTLISVDINGSRKPNQVGRDIFGFALKKNGLVPAGTNGADTCQPSASGVNGEGWSCAYKVISQGKMDY